VLICDSSRFGVTNGNADISTLAELEFPKMHSAGRNAGKRTDILEQRH
jgi:hypothetical protein